MLSRTGGPEPGTLERTATAGPTSRPSAGGTLLRRQLDGRVREVPLPVVVRGFLDCFYPGLYLDLE